MKKPPKRSSDEIAAALIELSKASSYSASSLDTFCDAAANLARAVPIADEERMKKTPKKWIEDWREYGGIFVMGLSLGIITAVFLLAKIAGRL